MDINVWAVALASVAGVLVGSLWFGPKTFFPRWWQALGKSADDQPGGSNMALVFGFTFVAIVVQALVLAVVISLASSAMGELGWFGGLATGALMGVGFAVSASLTHKLFGGINLWTWVLEAGADIVALALMGAIIGAF